MNRALVDAGAHATVLSRLLLFGLIAPQRDHSWDHSCQMCNPSSERCKIWLSEKLQKIFQPE